MQTAHAKGATWAGGLKGSHFALNDNVTSTLLRVCPLRSPSRRRYKTLAALKVDNAQKPPQPSTDLALESRSSAGGLDTFKDALDAAKSAPVKSAGTAAMFSGAAAMSVLMSGAVLHSIDVVPLVPAALQLLGVSASSWFALRYVSTKAGARIPPSPIRALSQLLDQRPGGSNLDLSAVPNLDEETKRKLKVLAEERDAALAEMEKVKASTGKVARLVAEKEALEAVAMQLAEERDEAMGEVRALKGAVDAMTERMRAIEAMLAQEVGELRQQNQALETVALQLASERDSALAKVAELQKLADETNRAAAERDAVQLVAARLADERDSALSALKSLRKGVPSSDRKAAKTK
ncbi:hypothetical protein KFL_000490030 [Klebsormidium nitens]|uniref:Cyanobacterial aminoacyl-tRNA synthetase CAAD domain-containing protein n=1 Tax=Klebsormidium nitens TaxID=105231 RepID=A0A0U9HKU2_KLENI|nr:hypothetical protein KFL_000490030 [Klebsormidium nitens]|eukprot:GAQ80213.1 hypothetical protein KFL_000490030 [Klebsormidium nitens]